jgi:hypothetical protein
MTLQNEVRCGKQIDQVETAAQRRSMLLVLLIVLVVGTSFRITSRGLRRCGSTSIAAASDEKKWIEVSVPLGRGYNNVACRFQPLFAKSSIFAVTYPLPCELNVDAPSAECPAPEVNQDSSMIGGELKGRFCWRKE